MSTENIMTIIFLILFLRATANIKFASFLLNFYVFK